MRKLIPITAVLFATLRSLVADDAPPLPPEPPPSISLTYIETHAPPSHLDLQQVTINWEPSPTQNLIGYRVHIGESPGVYWASSLVFAPAPSYLWMGGLWRGRTYYFAVTAVRDVGGGLWLDSRHSPEVSFTVPMVPPPNVRQFAVGYVWNPDLVNYREQVEFTRDLVDWKRIPLDQWIAREDGSYFLPRLFFPRDDPHRFFRVRRDPR